MESELRKILAGKATTEEDKWLFGKEHPDWMIYIYGGLEDAFIKWYEAEYLKDEDWQDVYCWGGEQLTHVELLKKMWAWRCTWIKKFNSLIQKPLSKKYITGCCVETRQEYSNFKNDDLLAVIEAWGKAATHLYCAQRDIFNSCPVLNAPEHEPLNVYYLLSLEYLMWHFATFVQEEGSFTDFYTKIESELKSI